MRKRPHSAHPAAAAVTSPAHVSRQLKAAAEQQLAQGRVDAAEELLLQARRADPQSPEVNGTLAVIAIFKGRPAQAIDLATQALQHSPRDATLHFTLGRAYKAAGELPDAVLAYRRAVELNPAYAEAHVSLGIALKAQGELDAAIACYRRAIELAPGLAVAHTNLGAALALQAERSTARAVADDGLPTPEMIAAQQRAAQLDPHDAEVQRNLGAILLRAGRHLEAAHAFNAALSLDTQDLQSCLHLGGCLVSLGDHALAREAYEKWLACNAANAQVMRQLANALTMLGEADAGLDWAQRSLALEADPITAMQLGNSLLQARRIEEALLRCREGVEQSQGDPALYPVLLMAQNYLHEEPQPIFAAHAELGPKLAPLLDRAPARPRTAGERLRVGYLSGDFIRHSVAFFITPLLARHDVKRFEVFCYHNNPRSDRVTERLKSFGHRWVDCAHLSDEALDRRIRSDGIDILVDLTGQTANSRMLMLARGPAPVQIGYLGYPTISGVPTLDWRITDGAIDPGDMPAFPSEQPLVLPRSMFCYEPVDPPPLADPPALQRGVITFGSFNNVAKITDHTLDLWSRVLAAVPGSRLLLKAASMAQASVQSDIAAFFAARGIAAQRLDMRSRTADDSHHLALYNEIDVALDTTPYNGATTTCEALVMGLPVATLRGRTHTGRMGTSLLRAVGRPDWIAADDDGFVRIATALAADLAGLSEWRRAARATLAGSELCDAPGFARAFENALMHAWEQRSRMSAATPAASAAAG